MSYHWQLLTSACHWSPMESDAFPISTNPKHFQAMSMLTLIKHLLISSAILHLYQVLENAVQIRPSQILHLWFISHPSEKYPPHYIHEEFDNECKGFLSWVLHRTDSFPSFLVPATCTYLSPHKLRSANEHHWLGLEGSQFLYNWHYNNLEIWIRHAQMYTWVFFLT